MIDGTSKYSARATYIWWGTTDPDSNRGSDWALFRLDKKLGNTLGWLGIRTISLEQMKATKGTLVGYSTDFKNGKTAAAHINCRVIKQIKSNMFLHDCDANRGASGGPMFAYWNNQPSIYLIHVGEYRNGGDKSLHLPGYTDTNANIAIWSTELANKIAQLRGS